MALPFVAGTVTAIVNDAGSPALGAVVGGVMTMVGAAAMLTMTLPDAVPDAAGVVGVVGVPVVGVGDVELPTPTLAVTVAEMAVVSVTDATPAALVFATPALRVPVVVVNVTGTAFIRLPLTSKTVALMVVDPPSAGTVAGLAFTTTFWTAAVPTRIFSGFVPVLAPPEIAAIDAVPDESLVNVAVARPLVSVVASVG
jgi:hypothetical protein